VVLQLEEPPDNTATSKARITYQEWGKLCNGKDQIDDTMPDWLKRWMKEYGACTESCRMQWHQGAGVLKILTEHIEVTQASNTKWNLWNYIGILQRDGGMRLVGRGYLSLGLGHGNWIHKPLRDDEISLVANIQLKKVS